MAVADDTTMLHLHTDQTWSALAATDAAGQVVWRTTWDPFGTGTALDDAFNLTGGPVPDSARFQGRPLLIGDVVDFRSRVLHTGLGRFVQPDVLYPLGDPNPYRIVGNNTLVAVDPTGELIWFVPILAGALVGAAISAWANRNKTGADFWLPVAASALGGALAGSGLGVAGFAAGGAVTGGIIGAYEGGKRGGVGGALVGGTIGAIAGGVAGAVGGVVSRQVAGAVTTQALNALTNGALRSGATAAGLGATGRYLAASWAGTAAGGVAGGGTGGLAGGFVGGTGHVLANGGDFEDAVVSGADSALIGFRDGSLYGFAGGVVSRGLMQGGWRYFSGHRNGVLGNEGEWWLANQTLNRVNNRIPNMGEPDAWGVPRLPWAKSVFADAKNTQKIPSINGTNGQIQRYLNGLPNPFNAQTNPGGDRFAIYYRPGVTLPTNGSLAPFINQGLLQFTPLQQTVLIPPNPAGLTCAF